MNIKLHILRDIKAKVGNHDEISANSFSPIYSLLRLLGCDCQFKTILNNWSQSMTSSYVVQKHVSIETEWYFSLTLSEACVYKYVGDIACVI